MNTRFSMGPVGGCALDAGHGAITVALRRENVIGRGSRGLRDANTYMAGSSAE